MSQHDFDLRLTERAACPPCEMALYPYTQGRLSVGKARELAGMALWEFRQLLAYRRIPPHYDEADLDEDVATLRELGRL